MSAAIAIASSSNAAAAAAAAEARAAKVIACKKYVQGYEHNAATVADAKQYASCIRLLHPDDIAPGEVWMLKAAIVIVMLGCVAGVVMGCREGRNSFMGWQRFIFYPLFGGLLAAAALLGCGAVVAGVVFLFSA
jgi:hypothetical protein